MPIKKHFVTPRLTLDIFYLHINFGDSRFSRSRDMIAGIEIYQSPLPLTYMCNAEAQRMQNIPYRIIS